MEFNRAKFVELLLYVARKSESDPTFGATKLNKILFFADFATYRRLGQPITGAHYIRLEHGPAPRELMNLRRELIETGEVIEVERERYGFAQRPLVATREPRLSLFSGDEVAIVDQVLEELREHDARSVSELSHEFVGWRAARPNEEIPYEVALLTFEEPTARDREAGFELNQRYGWTGAYAK